MLSLQETAIFGMGYAYNRDRKWIQQGNH